MDIAIKLIQALGFPIFVCLWLMYRVEKRLDKIHKEQHRSNVLQAVMLKTLDEDTAIPENVLDEISSAHYLSDGEDE